VSARDDHAELLRALAPQVLGILVRRHGRFDACEDAVQEALLAAALQWPTEGMPDSPRGWLVTVASRRLTDQLRSEHARRRREDTAAAQIPADEAFAPAPARAAARARRHADPARPLLPPALSPPSQLALTLRAVGGLTTAEIASAFLVPRPPWPSASAVPSRASGPPAAASSCRPSPSAPSACAWCCTCST
jgi:predicted RNA polymerase sigma factor